MEAHPDTSAAERLEDVQERVDAIRRRLPDNPGLTLVDEDDIPAYFEDGIDTPTDKGTAAEQDDPRDHEVHPV